jgi:broad specificity phosphatase PhoE
MTLTLHFLRHGQTALSREDVFCGSGLDPELTPEGLEMAQAFAAASRAKSWTAIYCSALRRAKATARPVWEATKLELEVREELNEIAYGKWEGLSKEAVDRDFHDDYISWLADPAWHPPTEGEAGVLVARRGLQVVEEIKSQCGDGDVLVVSHKATIRIIICSLLGIDVGRFRHRLVCPVGSASVVEFTSHGPLLTTLADRSHLSQKLRSLPGT